MILPPYLLDLRIEPETGHRIRLWLPLFLLWPLLLVLGVLALVLTILADCVLAVMGSRYHSYTLLLIGCFGMFAELRGTTVHVDSTDALVYLAIR